MPDDLVVRPYRPDDDEERIRTLHERALRSVDAYVADETWDADLRAIGETYVEGDGTFLLGVLDGDVVAMGALKPRDGATAEVTRMRVAPDHQRRGFGTRVLTELERHAVDRGFERLVLDTTERQVGARRLYEGFDYEQVATVEWREYTVLFYEKTLD